MEFFEDYEKYEKNFRGDNSNFRGEFGNSKIVEPADGGDRQIQKFFDRFWYMEHQNRSSYAKVIAVLRTDSELEDKTVRNWEKFPAVARNWWKWWEETHKLDSNKT